MSSLLLITNNIRERQILKIAFEQLKVEVIEANPDHASYIQALQFKPDVVVIAFPKYYQDHMNFCRNISNIREGSILIIGYGYDFPVMEKKAIMESGVKAYLSRPLKFSHMMKIIEGHFNTYAPEKLTWKNTQKSDDQYSEKIFDKDFLPTKKLDLLSEKVESLMAFPFTVAQVLKLTNDPNSGAGDLAKVIEADPVIAASILKMSNSVFFASRSNRKISSIKESIVRIGFKETKHIVMTMSVMNILSSDTESLGFVRKDFWKHSLSVAIFSDALGKQITGIDSSEIFLAGLLHAFGIILYDEFFSEVFLRLLKETSNKATSFHEVEKEETVITHLDVTKRLFESWHLPPLIAQGVYQAGKVPQILRENAEKDRTAISTEDLYGMIIHAADILAKSCRHGGECDQFVSPMHSEILSILNKKTGFNLDFFDKVKHEIEMFSMFLKLKEVPADPDFDKLFTQASPLMYVDNRETFFPLQAYYYNKGISPKVFFDAEAIRDYEDSFDILYYLCDDKKDNQILNVLQSIAKEKGGAPLIVFETNPEEEKAEATHFLDNSIDFRYVEVLLKTVFEEMELVAE